jgi:hypothetical protein
MIDLGDKSIMLTYNREVLFTSIKPRLRPLLELVSNFIEGKFDEYASDKLLLTDKVIGLAAAKLIVHSKKIKHVETVIASKSAIHFLRENDVKIHAEKIVDTIMNPEGNSQCIMEIKSQNLSPEEFYTELKIMMKM